MHLVDTTMFYCPRGGGVKRYLLAKQAWARRSARTLQHSLLVPKMHDGESRVATCDAWAIPLVDGYRFPISLTQWQRSLESLGPDLIEAGDPYIPAWATRRVGEKLGIPIVAFFHSDLPRMLEQRVKGWVKPLARSYLRTLYAGFDLIFAPSHAMLEQLDAWGIRNIALQPLGVDTAVFTPTRRDGRLRRELGLPDETRLLVYAGRFAREKNLSTLVAAVERLGPPYHLLLVGGAQRAALNAHTTILPYERSEARLARLIASCDAFVHAGDQETFGLVVIEAMACGLPVVAIASGGVKELVSEQVGVPIDKPDTTKLSAAIAALFERDLSALGRAARAQVLQAHSWDVAFRQLFRRYAKLAGEPSLQAAMLGQLEA